MYKIKKILKDNWIILLGGVLTILYLYSKVIFGEYEFNFNNVMYAFSPWNSSGVGISGPLLSDISDNLLASIYKIFYSNSGFSFWNSSANRNSFSRNVRVGTTVLTKLSASVSSPSKLSHIRERIGRNSVGSSIERQLISIFTRGGI